MASRTLEGLPHELLICCCSYLKGSIADIRNLRLTSKCLCNASSLFLFDTLTIRITSKSISTLEAVSNHPIFKKTIRTIKLCLCFYGDIQDQLTRIGLISECDRHFHSIWLTVTRVFNAAHRTAEETEQFNRISVRIGEIKQALNSLELEAIGGASASLDFAPFRMITNGFDLYKSCFVNQQVAIKDGTHLTRIGVALSKLCRPLSFELHGYIGTRNEINPRSCSIATTMEWLNSDEMCSDMTLNVMASRGQDLTLDVERRFAQTFKGIFAQLSNHKIFPSRLTVDFNAPKRLQLLRSHKGEQDTISSVVRRAEHLSFAVRCWTKQELNFGVVTSAVQHYEDMQHLASLTKPFFKTKSVRSMDLDIHDYSPHIDPPHISLFELLPDCEWPQLQALSLVAVPFHERELRNLVDRLRKSLKILDMDGLQILSGSWKTSFQILRQLDDLEEVSCRWPGGGEYGSGSHEDDLVFRFSEEDVCQYILKVKDAENPLG